MATAAPGGRSGSRSPTALLVLLLAALTYAVFAHGATTAPAETRVQLALALAALPALAAVVTGRPGMRIVGAPAARLGLVLLLAFAAWCGLSLLWSVTPDRTWTEINRALAYTLVAGLGLVAGASAPRAIERVATGWLLLALAVALYGLGSKTIPGVNVPGIVNFDQTGTLARLRAPLDYWNALGLLLAMAVPVALRIAVDRGRDVRVRVAAMLAAYLLTIDLGMTYSRGGVLAIVVALATLTALGRHRLRTLIAALVAGVAAAGPLALALTKHGLSDSGVDLGTRIHDGRQLAALVVVAGGLLAGAAVLLLREEDRVVWSAARTRSLGRLAVTAASVVLLVGVVGLTASTLGLPGQVHKAARSFTVPSQDKQLDPSRLATTTSGNRWVWWQEAAGAFSDRPVGGWGAGSFRATHLRYRTNTISVVQPHSVPLQMLAETGLVGFLLVYGGLGALLWAAVARLRALPDGRERELGAALVAASVAWLAHGVYDWDWDIPGITLPPLLFLGVVAGGGVPRPRRGLDLPGASPVVMFVDPERDSRLRPGALAGVAVVVLALFAYGTSAVLPAWSQSKADAAQAALGGDNVSDAEIQKAAAEADLAARLDPLSIEPLLVEATIAQRRGRDLEARDDLLEAVRRQPDSSRAWFELGALALPLADRQGFVQASLRALALDPHNPLLRTLAFRAISFATPPGESATATGTPLPPAPAPVTAGAVVAPVTPGAAPVPGAAGGTATGTPDPGAATAGPPGTDPGAGATSVLPRAFPPGSLSPGKP
ncbi:O-antigen ligase family protein [Paraconexibacter antarcticus]|uniref:O-antigen ligase family protein n=1 Tax=Paraconexibacter antarcticus TaxID=2949664 RepID=A0ABY5DVN0_9ACTN|nr:O-antigen ligase family protein [Paraconexibacter antarcticus]UTI65131.1 O-antigen ligase family protein [Paraconexibacter antarcticus]